MTSAVLWGIQNSTANKVTQKGGTGSDSTDAKLAKGIYDKGFNEADGYKLVTDIVAQAVGLPEARFSDKNGLQGGLFANADGDYVLVIAGTKASSWANWKANLKQAFGFKSAQYELGIQYALDAYAVLGSHLRFTGHSLGGGIASASAIITGGRATTFNAAGLHRNTVGRYGASLSGGTDLIRSYSSTFDMLKIGNLLTPASVPGQRISLGAAGMHGMSGMCNAMGGC